MLDTSIAYNYAHYWNDIGYFYKYFRITCQEKRIDFY